MATLAQKPADTTSRKSRSVPAALVATARPKQWTKNLLVFAAPAAAGVLDEPDVIAESLVAFVAFCLASSATYFLNDVLDADADRQHPRKRHRPVASGELTRRSALATAVVLGPGAIALSFAASWELAAATAGYLALTLSYSVWLKHVAVVDLAAVAAGFVLRLIAGGLAVGVPISEWFLIVAAAGSFFMVTGKRGAESLELGSRAAAHRVSLGAYSSQYLLYLRALSSAVAVLGYCLWAFERADEVTSPVWYQLSTVPFVLGILRYALLLDRGGGGSPEDLLLSDPPILAIGAVWAVTFGLAVYVG